MEKKTLIQLALLLFLIISLLWVFNKYRQSGEIKILSNKKVTKILASDENENIIKDIKYSLNSINGDSYILDADYGKINLENPDLIFMTRVRGAIKFEDSENINISSDFANFNNKTFETTFFDNVKIIRSNEIIIGGKLYLVLEVSEDELKSNPQKRQNLIKMTENVIFKKPGYSLKTDVVEIDLITKNSKIYMIDKLDKVIVNKIN